MRVIWMALALCALAFALNLVGDFTAGSQQSAAAAVSVGIPPQPGAP